jgi:hypothetical protein
VHQLIKALAATARAGPSAFTINASAEAQVLPLRGQCRRQQNLVTSDWLACGPAAHIGGHARRLPLSGPTQTWPKFEPGMGQAGCVGSVALPHWRGRNPHAGPVRSIQTHAEQMRRPARDALRDNRRRIRT